MAKQKTATVGMGIVWFVLGLVLVLNNNPAGYAFFVLAVAFLAGPDFPMNLKQDNSPSANFSGKGVFILSLIFFIIITGIALFLIKN